MIRLIQFLILGHWHKWKIIEKEPYTVWDGGIDTGRKLENGMFYTLQCEHCGDIKSVRS